MIKFFSGDLAGYQLFYSFIVETFSAKLSSARNDPY